MTLETFIQTTIIDEIKIMVGTPRLQYLSFIVMSSAIEFLGACLDTKDFHIDHRSRMRFELAIKSLGAFSRYSSFISGGGSGYDLFAELRCGMVHAALPKSKVELIQRAEINSGIKHLQEANLQRTTNPKRLILVCEDLCNDIHAASIEVIGELKTGKYLHKATDPFLATDI